VRKGESGVWRASHELPAGFVRGTVGAGDAFFAGVVLGVYEGWPLERSLRFANTAAASCLRHPTCTGGVGSADEIWQLAESLPTRTD
jgi:sugar/nucleoside kinase (ribokinase family)